MNASIEYMNAVAREYERQASTLRREAMIRSGGDAPQQPRRRRFHLPSLPVMRRRQLAPRRA